MEEDQNQEDSNIFQFTSLTLFDEDPLSPDISLLQPEQQPHPHTLHLFPEEELLNETHFRVHMELVHGKTKCNYEMVVTSYRLIFFQFRHSQQQIQLEVGSQSKAPISLPYGFVEEVDLVKREIVIGLKTGLIYRIKPFTQLNKIYQAILHGFAYLPFFTKQVGEEEVSNNYDCLAQLERMRIPWEQYMVIPNLNGKLSPTYPKYYIITKSISENLMEENIKLRNHGRIPVLTYFCSRFNSGLWRAARPKINQESNKYNKAYLKQISRNLITIDLRHDEPAVKEKEAKSDVSYRKFQNLPALHDLFKKILILYARNEGLLKVIGRWFQDVSQLILTAYLVIKNLQLGKQVLLQEQSGFDRTAQISALVQLILDPFFRTVHGFSLLIEKEFVSFGHPFGRRLGFEREKIAESSPIFIQFLECVNQLVAAHPQCFEFSSFYLARIGYQTYSTKYNNFYYNTQKEKLSEKWASKTPSIWQIPMRKEYYNYQWIEKEAIKPLNLVRRPPSVKQFIIWKEYYDIVAEMKCEYPDKVNVKQRRSSLYKMLHRRDSKQV